MHRRRVEACPACGLAGGVPVARLNGTGRQRFLELSERKYGGLMNGWLAEIDLVISRCNACGHHWYVDQPGEQELAALYEAGRPLFAAAKSSDTGYSRRMLTEMRRLYFLTRSRGRAGAPTLLDYGSGFGRWAHAAAVAGFEVTAYEPSGARGAQARSGASTISDFSDLRGRRFDAINVEQVLEHTPDPFTELRRLSAMCHGRTALRVTVPNVERPAEGHALWRDWPFDGRRMHTMSPFEHLHGFTPRSLEALLRRAGFVAMPARSLWRCDAPYVARRLMRRIVPRLGQTKLIAVPAADAGAAGESG